MVPTGAWHDESGFAPARFIFKLVLDRYKTVACANHR
jgi:hypothetical protein